MSDGHTDTRPGQWLLRPGGRLQPVRTTALYAGLAVLWVVVAHVLLGLVFIDNPPLQIYADIVAGLAFVALTALPLYLLLHRAEQKIEAAEHDIEDRRRTQNAERARTERIAKIGHWIWRPDAGSADWRGGSTSYSEAAAAILGVPAADLAIANRDYVARYIHPEDQEKATAAFAAIGSGRPEAYSLEYRFVRPDGEIRTIHEIAENVFDAAGHQILSQGTMQDVTEQRRIESDLRESRARLDLALQSARAAYWELEMPGGAHKLADNYFEILGYETPPRDRAGWLDLIHADDIARVQAQQTLPPFDQRDHEYEFRIKAADGSWRWFLSRFHAAAFDHWGRPTRLQGIDSDITALKEAELAAHLARDRAQLYFDVAGAVLVVLDVESRIVMLNRRGGDVLCMPEREAIGLNWFDAFSPPEERDAQRASFVAFLAGERGQSQDIDMALVTAKGETRLVSWHDTLLHDAQGKVVGALSSGEDTTERRKLEHRLEQLATRDELTGAYNRRYLLSQAPIEMARSKRYHHAISFLFLDLDHFKSINDRFGHPVGDLALKSFAQLCERMLRPGDVFTRYGGEEFVVMLPETDLQQAAAVAWRLAIAWRKVAIPTKPPISGLTVSIGASQMRKEEDDLDSILDRVDKAAYRAKQLGRDRIEAYP